VALLTDLVTGPTFAGDEIEREKKVILEEIKMVEDTPDDLVHEIFAERFWGGHPLGLPILGTPDSVGALDRDSLTRYFRDTYVAGNFVVVAVGNLEHDAVRTLIERAFAGVAGRGSAVVERPPVVTPGIDVRHKDLEQSHVCFGTTGLPQCHADRYACFVLNTVLGGSMSSRLFQNVREKRGLAYSVSSGLSAYRDVGALSVYAGCGNDAVAELIDVVVAEIRRLREEPMPGEELRRAQDHLKGSLMLGLESTSSRMSHLARQEIYDDRSDGLDEMLAAIEHVTVGDVSRLAGALFGAGSLGLTVLGDVNGLTIAPERVTV